MKGGIENTSTAKENVKHEDQGITLEYLIARRGGNELLPYRNLKAAQASAEVLPEECVPTPSQYGYTARYGY